MNHENSGTILLAVAGLGAAVALAATFACCCTLRQHPALLYLVSHEGRSIFSLNTKMLM